MYDVNTSSKMETRVVLDADWFVINGQKYVKRLAYSVVGKPLHGEYELTLPSWVKPYRAALECQAKHSHHLDWSTTGQYDQEEIQKVFEEIETTVSGYGGSISYWAKGTEKCGLLESYIGPVINLEQFGCPKYCHILALPQTTLKKAIAFSLWLDSTY
jgi:hypothetical protein